MKLFLYLVVLLYKWMSLKDLFEKIMSLNKGWVVSLIIVANFLTHESWKSSSKRDSCLVLIIFSDRLITALILFFSFTAQLPPHDTIQKEYMLWMHELKNRISRVLSTWNVFNFLRRWSLWLILEWTFLTCGSHDRSSSKIIPRYLYWFTLCTVWSLIRIGSYGESFILKSNTISFVFDTFNWRKWRSHHSTKFSTVEKYSCRSFSDLMRPVILVSSA